MENNTDLLQMGMDAVMTKQENEILIKASDELKKALQEQIEVQQ